VIGTFETRTVNVAYLVFMTRYDPFKIRDEHGWKCISLFAEPAAVGGSGCGGSWRCDQNAGMKG
jgi:hypothetical protein